MTILKKTLALSGLAVSLTACVPVPFYPPGFYHGGYYRGGGGGYHHHHHHGDGHYRDGYDGGDRWRH